MYYLLFGILYVFSLLPIGVLYIFSDFFYFLIYYVFGYRKEIVFSNLKESFPEKSEEEIKKIAKKFYRNLTDSFIEIIKLLSAGKKFISKRFYGDYSVFYYLYKKGKKCQVHTSHNFNWEYANLSASLEISHTMLTVYMPIKNKPFDKIMKKIRTRTGVILLSATNAKNDFLPYRNDLYALILVADQNPGDPSKAYWLNFLGRPAPFIKGPESGARRGNIPVVFSYFVKEKRGFYKVYHKLAEEKHDTTQAG
jgi:KDO2-lipid IV(A) lauroyltransferase